VGVCNAHSMPHDVGPLVPADETLTHQIIDTFATVAQSDPSWTEKVWAVAHARDGSLQVVFGIGKYTNRGVFDGAGGVARGTDQWTVRGSRRLSSDPGGTSVGPLHYEVVQPLNAVRCVLEPTAHAAIAFDVTWRGSHPVSMEQEWPDRSPDGYRVSHDVLRYHQVGTASGWVEVDGERTTIDSADWISVRDHSWGLRPGVGLPIPGLPRGQRQERYLMTWFPMLMERADGSTYSLFVFFEHKAGAGFESTRSQAEEQWDGGSRRFASVSQDLHFTDANRRMTGGTLTLHGSDGGVRPLHIQPVSDTGFHLGTGGYFGWKGRVLGQWAGDLVVDGEHVSGVDTPAVAREVHQLRDLLVRVEDPVGGGTGLGNLETMAIGAFPELGLTAEASFL
jgi:hypothetical protein